MRRVRVAEPNAPPPLVAVDARGTEVTLHVQGKELHCESEQEDLYAAIDLLVDKLDRQVLRYKEKRGYNPRA